MKISKLYPECKDYIWGGEKLKEKCGKQTDKTPCAERCLCCCGFLHY